MTSSSDAPPAPDARPPPPPPGPAGDPATSDDGTQASCQSKCAWLGRNLPRPSPSASGSARSSLSAFPDRARMVQLVLAAVTRRGPWELAGALRRGADRCCRFCFGSRLFNLVIRN
ncbi:hypothetical protein HBB16_08625 [Pseudonocardia sp. MCCB 268]|nr:hypothetical protein [Pseudonocardia cytotoxica]